MLQQVDAGRLTLDSRLGDLLDLAGTTLSPDITVRHLLTHTSGIADDADEEAGESYEALWEDRPSYSVTTTADFLPQFAHKPPRVAPGEDCRYCNVGYILAGLVLEKVTGQTFRDYVVEHVFTPLGLTAGFFDMRHAESDVAEGWDLVGEGDDARWRLNIFSYPPIGSPDGGAHATSRDLVRFLTAVRSGALLSPELTEAFCSPPGPAPRRRGRAARLRVRPRDRERLRRGRDRRRVRRGAAGVSTRRPRHYRPAPGRPTISALLTHRSAASWASAA